MNPFLTLYQKSRNRIIFGEINNILYYSFLIHPFEIDKDKLLKNFISKYLLNTKNIIEQPSDVGVTLDQNSDGKQMSLHFGPYFGEQELKKRNITIKNPIAIEVANNIGLCFEFKLFNSLKTISFHDYKEICKTEKQYIQKVWEI